MAKSRTKEAPKREMRGVLDPWQRSSDGPLREGIIAVNKSWFSGAGHEEWGPEKATPLRDAALTFIKQHFPNGELRYASGHGDEEAYQIHFVIAVWRERIGANRGHSSLGSKTPAEARRSRCPQIAQANRAIATLETENYQTQGLPL